MSRFSIFALLLALSQSFGQKVPSVSCTSSEYVKGDGSCGTGGSGAPSDAEYIVAESNAGLSGEIAPSAANQVPVSSSSTAAAWGTVPDAALTSNYSGVGSCTNQFARGLNDNAAPTCASVATADISDDQVTYAKLQNVTDARLLGRSAGSSGDAQEITVGSGLTLSGGSLTASGADPWTYLTVNGGADFTTSSATAVDVTGLSFTPSANTKYEFECKLAIRSPTTATVNPRVGFAWSTGLSDGVALITESQAATGTPLYAAGNPNAALLIAVGGLPNTTQSWPVIIQASVEAGASPSGTTRVQLASETAATNVTIKAVGSRCRYRTY